MSIYRNGQWETEAISKEKIQPMVFQIQGYSQSVNLYIGEEIDCRLRSESLDTSRERLQMAAQLAGCAMMAQSAPLAFGYIAAARAIRGNHLNEEERRELDALLAPAARRARAIQDEEVVQNGLASKPCGQCGRGWGKHTMRCSVLREGVDYHCNGEKDCSCRCGPCTRPAFPEHCLQFNIRCRAP